MLYIYNQHIQHQCIYIYNIYNYLKKKQLLSGMHVHERKINVSIDRKKKKLCRFHWGDCDVDNKLPMYVTLGLYSRELR